jgi:hypothetical protein
LKTAAQKRHENIQRMALNDRHDNDNIRDQLASQKPQGIDGNPTTGIRESSVPQTSTSPRLESPTTVQPAKTPEQAKQERRERRREERRQEKIDALGKAFMNLNPQQPIGEAIQERPSSASEQRAQKAAANAAPTTPTISSNQATSRNSINK